MRSILKFTLSATFFSLTALGQAPSLPPGLEEPSEPSLPSGLEEPSEPSLPSGLGGTSEPSLPSGLAGLETSTSKDSNLSKTQSASLSPKVNVRFNASLESTYGTLLQSNPQSDDKALSEIRLQTQWSGSTKSIQYRLTADWIADFLADSSRIDLRNGQGWIDPREAWISTQPLDYLDLKIGRQIATWGTGDLLFISDLFPKDWQALLLGRNEEYLKAPSDAIKASFFSNPINLDIVYTPEFDPDRFVTGERISYFDTQSDSIQGKNQIIRADYPTGSEIAVRAHRLFGNAETALYFQNGFWKQPTGFDPSSNQPTFPKLDALSASWRKPLAGGIASVEAGYYESRDDPNGIDGNIRNSETRFLAGFERELAKNLTGSFQYYVERIEDYSGLLETLPTGGRMPDRSRTVLTARITQQLMMQDLQLSLFTFYSPSDRDAYLRPTISYTINDLWKISAGANLFYGKNRDSFFGQFEDSSNAYFAVKRSFN